MTQTDAPIPIGDFDYELPTDRIAQHPIEPRDSARLLVVEHRGGRLHDRIFRDLPGLLRAGDLLVLNDTRVIPARLGARRRTGGAVSLLLLSRDEHGTWTALARPLNRLKAGDELMLLDRRGEPSSMYATITRRSADTVQLRFSDESAIDLFGEMPLPPYIKSELGDGERYQTVFSKIPGSAAAPTAGLHFTPELLETCRRSGVRTASVTLHVGRDTFQPVRETDARQHVIHTEAYEVPQATCEAIVETRRAGGRVVAVGTTSVRTLETVAERVLAEHQEPLSGQSQLYILPGFRFQLVDALITNFHLPGTTLLLLVSAFAGWDVVRDAYRHAIEARYRFYSFGDAMLIV